MASISPLLCPAQAPRIPLPLPLHNSNPSRQQLINSDPRSRHPSLASLSVLKRKEKKRWSEGSIRKYIEEINQVNGETHGQSEKENDTQITPWP
jgi:hypothetical protein